MDTHAQTHTLPQIQPFNISHKYAMHVCVCVCAHLMDPLFIIQNLVRIIQKMCLSIISCQMAS